MELLVLVHDRLATSMMLFMLVAGAWGLASFARGGELGGSIAGTFVIGQFLVVAQALVGVALVVLGSRPADWTHFLYGVTAVVVMPFAWSYLRGQYPRQSLMIYSLLALFIFGLAIRGMVTGASG